MDVPGCPLSPSKLVSTGPLPLKRLEEVSSGAFETCWTCARDLEHKSDSALSHSPNGQTTTKPLTADKDRFESDRYHLRQLAHALSEVRDFSANIDSRLANIPALLIVGPAGTGKTHLLCDAATHRNKRDLPTILLLGVSFTAEDPLSQIPHLLGLKCSREEFLAALDVAAEARNCRALILIDALNEGEARHIWKQHLGGILAVLRRYTRLGLAITVRSSYEDLVVPDNLIDTRLLRAVHRVADNFEFRQEYGEKAAKYEGPWQLWCRDIDPSFLLEKTARESYWGAHSSTWWFPAAYNEWDASSPIEKWLKRSDDLPKLNGLIELENPLDGSRWFCLDAHYRWEEPIPAWQERSDAVFRSLSYSLQAYLVREDDSAELAAWAKRQDFWGRWMPESRDLYRVFLGEFHRSPAYKYHDDPYYSSDDWSRGTNDRVPKPVRVTTESYAWESGGYDCSIEETIRIPMLTKCIAEGMKLNWLGKEGKLFDPSGRLVAFDPSVETKGPSALLVRRESILSWLRENHLRLLWTLVGEKQIIGERIAPEKLPGWIQISGTASLNDRDQVTSTINARIVRPK